MPIYIPDMMPCWTGRLVGPGEQMYRWCIARCGLLQQRDHGSALMYRVRSTTGGGGGRMAVRLLQWHMAFLDSYCTDSQSSRMLSVNAPAGSLSPPVRL